MAVSGRSQLGDLTRPSLGPVAPGPAPGLRPHPWLQSSEARPAPNTATLPSSLAPGSTPGFGSLTVAVPTHPPTHPTPSRCLLRLWVMVGLSLPLYP